MLFCVTREEFCHKTKRGSQWRVLLRRRTQTRKAELATLHYRGSVDGWQEDFRIIYCCFLKAKLCPFASEMEHFLLQWARLSFPQAKETTQSPSSFSFLQNCSAQLGAPSSTVRPCSFTPLPAECRLGRHWPAYMGCEGLGPACGLTATGYHRQVFCKEKMDLMPCGHPCTVKTETPQPCWLHVSQLQAWPARLVVDPGPTTVPTAAHSLQPLCHGTGDLHGQKEVLSQPFSAFLIAFFLPHPLLLLFPAGLVLCWQVILKP